MSTIAAIATAPGNGGIGIIRISGKNAFEIINKIFIPKNNKDEIKGYIIKYGHIINSENNKIIDEVLVSFFKGPKSYTAEDVCEISSHGGVIIEKQILEQCLKNGAQLAEPGEFTKRAFINGRIDLIQAESVIDIINSKTNREAKSSINQLQGDLSKKINNIKNKILDIMADIEANIDYPEYDIEEITNVRICAVMEEIKIELQKLEESFDVGKILREGVKTVIVGKPNTGKSSLLNAILKEERAIVSEYEGTTRDTIEELINIRGIPLKIVDTAGIRETSDFVEKIGVSKALKLIDNADLIIAIFDISRKLDKEDFKVLEMINNKNAILLLNKVDLNSPNSNDIEKLKDFNKKVIEVSVKNNLGLESLYEEICKMYSIDEINTSEDVIVTNVRHKNQISKSIDSITCVIDGCKKGVTIDITALYIKQILEDLSVITGENVSEDIINEIFSKFCLGK